MEEKGEDENEEDEEGEDEDKGEGEDKDVVEGEDENKEFEVFSSLKADLMLRPIKRVR